jgi:hypothetical protein
MFDVIGLCVLSRNKRTPNSVANSQVAPSSRVLVKLEVAQVIQKFPYFMQSINSLLCSQEPVIGPYPEPDISSPRPQTLCLSDPL